MLLIAIVNVMIDRKTEKLSRKTEQLGRKTGEQRERKRKECKQRQEGLFIT